MRKKILNNLGLSVYVFLTLTYILLLVFIEKTILPLPQTPLTSFVGLFVPTGIWISALSLGIAPIITGIYFFFFDRYTSYINLSLKRRVIWVFVNLFVISMIFDIVMFKDFVSIKFFLSSIDLIEYSR